MNPGSKGHASENPCLRGSFQSCARLEFWPDLLGYNTSNDIAAHA